MYGMCCVLVRIAFTTRRPLLPKRVPMWRRQLGILCANSNGILRPLVLPLFIGPAELPCYHITQLSGLSSS